MSSNPNLTLTCRRCGRLFHPEVIEMHHSNGHRMQTQAVMPWCPSCLDHIEGKTSVDWLPDDRIRLVE